MMALSLVVLVAFLFFYFCLHPDKAQDYIDFAKKLPLSVLVCGAVILAIFFVPALRKTLRHLDP